MSIASVSDVGLVRLVASGYRWVHGSATEMAVMGPLPLSRLPGWSPRLGRRLWPKRGSADIGASLYCATNRTIYGPGGGPPEGLGPGRVGKRAAFCALGKG